MNIAFAIGGAHLPIAHALRLLSTQELRFGLSKLNLRKKEEKRNLARVFWRGEILFEIFKSFFLFLNEIELEKNEFFGREFFLGGGNFFKILFEIEIEKKYLFEQLVRT